jgi:hypothetical protein
VSRLPTEARWFLVNYALLNAVCFLWGLVSGAVLLATEPGFIGNYGSPMEAVVWWAVGSVIYLSFLIAIPILAVVLVLWWFASHAIGRPRLIAYVLATIVCLGAVVLIPRTDPLNVALLLFLPTFAYATVARAPLASGPRAAGA